MKRRHLVASVLLLTVGCSDDEPKKSLHGQRNLACLHSQRETEEGYEASIKLLEGVVGSEEVVFEDWLNLARAQVLHSKQVARAFEAIEKARTVGSDERGLAALDYVEGLFHKAKENPGKAHDLFKRVLSARPDHPEALYQCGYAAELAGRLDDAKKRYERLIQIKRLVRPAAYRLSKAAAKSKDTATETRALALFQSRDKKEKPETTKCDLTDLDMRRFARKDVESPRVELAFGARQIEASEPIRAVLACPAKGPSGVHLYLLGVNALWSTPASQRIPFAGVAKAVVIDLDNKPGQEIVLGDNSGFRAFGPAVDGRLNPLPVQFPKSEGTAPLTMVAFDEDHDGDLDIVLVTGDRPHRVRILRNKGDGGFEWKDSFEMQLPFITVNGGLDAHDLDQANDLDLVFAGGLSLNLRGDRYKHVPLPALAERDLFAVEDFDNDGAPDIFAAGGKIGWTLLRNADAKGRPYDVRFLDPVNSGAMEVRDLVAADIDNDGDLDVLLATNAGLTLLRNSGGTLAKDSSAQIPVAGCIDVSVADLDGDGTLEILAVDGEGKPHIITLTGLKYSSVVVAPLGRKDCRSAIGTVTEIYADKLFQSAMIKSPFGLRFGLGAGGMAAIDGLRMRWPQGIRQSTPSTVLRKLPGWKSRRLVFKQIEGLVASCPFLYVRGGSGFRFHTDVLGIAPLAEWMPPGSTPALDPEEFIRIPGDRLTVLDGRVQLAITEELKETTYLDRVELLYADQPVGLEVLIDENLTQGAYDELKVHTFDRGAIAALAGATVRGVDHLAKLAKADGVYLHPYGEAPSQWSGWSEPHTMELTTGAPADVLIFQGRLAWYDSTVSYALAQNGRTWQPMRIERVHDNGRTEVLCADAGGPTGMDRTMIIPLGDELPRGTKLRVTAQHRFLWDCIRTAKKPTRKSPEIHRAQLSQATLYHHGYSEYVGDPATHEQGYDFDKSAPDDRYPRARGFANEYGDVRSLVQKHDDRLVIIVAGDAVKLDFRAPPPKPGFSRTWFLRLSGWAKESGFHNATGEYIEPLPFRGMSKYPPPPGERTSWHDAASVLTRRIR